MSNALRETTRIANRGLPPQATARYVADQKLNCMARTPRDRALIESRAHMAPRHTLPARRGRGL